jgi:hypothetical protein
MNSSVSTIKIIAPHFPDSLLLYTPTVFINLFEKNKKKINLKCFSEENKKNIRDNIQQQT